MKKGKMTFMSLQGFQQIIGCYVDEEEKSKRFSSRKSHDVLILPGTEMEAYYCETCKKINLLIDDKKF